MIDKELYIARSLTWRYLIALTLIASLATTAWISLRLVISQQQSTAAIVNVSGRQRMLSQRTALFATLLAKAPAEKRAGIRRQLQDAADLMERSHRGLTHGDADLGLPPTMSPTVHGMYFDAPNGVDKQVREYLAAVTSLLHTPDAELTPDNPDLRYIVQVAPSTLVNALDHMVHQYQLEGEAAITKLNRAETLVWLVTLLLLSLEAAFIFRPMVQRIRQIISRLLQATDNLYDSRERLRLVTENASDWLWETDSNGALTHFSRREPCPFADGELLGLTLPRLLDPDQPPTDWSRMQEAMAAKEAFRDLVFPLRAPSGATLWLRASGVPHLARNGEFLGYYGIWADITESMRADLDKLRLWAKVFDSSTEAIAITDAQANILSVNPAFTTITGYEAAEVVGSNPRLLQSGRHDKAFYQAMWETIHSTGSWHGEIWNKRKNGEIYPEWLAISAVRNEEGETLNYVAIFFDITERKRAEEALEALNRTLEQRVAAAVASNREKDLLLIQQSRLAAMGEMVHNIAHQWRQPLNALGLVLSNLNDAYQYHELDQETLDQAMQKGRNLIRNMSTTIDDFRFFFRRDQEQETFELRPAIEKALSLVGAGFDNNGIALELAEGGGEVKAFGYPNEFVQVLLNALNNAKDALQGHQVKNGRVNVAIVQDHGWATVSVRDNGGGIDPRILPKIFDPYFTTKPNGSGIGLYMSKMLMEHMNGQIEARNTAEGAEILLRIPLAP